MVKNRLFVVFLSHYSFSLRIMKNEHLKSLFIKNLKVFRGERHYTQEVLSELSGVSGIPDIECGRTTPNLNTMIKIADALNVDLWQLFYDWDSARPVGFDSSEVQLKYYIKKLIDQL